MIRHDLMKYALNALVSYGVFYGYDYLVEGKSSSFCNKDALSFSLSTVLSNVWYEVVEALVPYLNQGHLAGMIGQPLLTGVIYLYLYNYMVGNDYRVGRTNNNVFLMGSLGSLIVNYIENPLLSLFGVRSY